MSKRNLALEKEAEELERQSKQEIQKKNYDVALLLLKDAKDIYIQLGFQGQIGIIEKNIFRVKSLIENEKPAATSSKPKVELDKKPVIHNIKPQETTKKSDTLERLRKTEKEPLSGGKDGYNQRKKELQEREAKIKQLAEAKRKEEEMVANANISLEKAKEMVDSKQFDEAKKFYEEAIEIFKEIKWTNQVNVLSQELKNVDKYKQDYLEKLKQEDLQKKKSEEEFQKRVDDILAEKRKAEEERLAILRALPPEMKIRVEKAKMLKEKAEEEIKGNKLDRAIMRYQYMIELYESIPKEKVDFSNDIKEVQQKIAELQQKK